MKIKSLFIFFMFFLLTINIFSIQQTLDFYFPELPNVSNTKGNIFIRDVKNLRTQLPAKNNIDFIGQYTRGFGMERVFITLTVDKLIKKIVTESLEYSGYKVVESKNNAYIMDVEILQLNTEMPYTYRGEFKIILYSKDGKTKIFEKTSFDYSGQGWGLVEVYKAYTKVIKTTMINLNYIFSSTEFEDSLKGKKYIELDEEIINESDGLKEIPNNITKNSKWASFYDNMIDKISNIDKLKSVEYLNLFDNKIKKIENLDSITGLKSLNLKNNLLTKIENLDGMKNLTNLDFGFNEIPVLENLDGLVKLERLCVSANKVAKIENISNLKNLKFLDLSMNGINKIENLDGLNKLLWLDLSRNPIAKIENLDGFNNLVYLNIARNNDLEKIEGLDNLKNLIHLDISTTSITKIENLDSLKKLKVLILFRNKIKRIENIEGLASLEKFWPPETVKTMSKESYEFLKKNNVLVIGLSVDDYLDIYRVKVK